MLSIALAFALLARCPPAFALNAKLDISQYLHTAWRLRDGFANGLINSIAQTPDGYLWLGTDQGLLRFDGMRTLPWQPPRDQHLPSNYITSLFVSRDGALWIGTTQGLASWKDGQLVRYDAFARAYTNNLTEDRDGSIWATKFTDRRVLCSIQDTHVKCFGEDGGPGADASALYEDRTGILWVGTAGIETGLWRWRPGRPTFHRLPRQQDGVQALTEDGDGSLVIADAGGVKRFVDAKLVTKYPATRLVRDRDGGLWAGTFSRGLVHVHEGVTDVFSQADGLSGDRITAICEDLEGTVWVATGDGLDRFRESVVVTYSVNEGLSDHSANSVLASTDGSIWVGTQDGLDRWVDHDRTVYREPHAALTVSRTSKSWTVHEIADVDIVGSIQSLFQDSRGRVWFSTSRGVGHLDNDRFVAVNGVPGGEPRAIIEDRHKTLWITDQHVGLLRLTQDGRDVEQVGWAALKHNDPITAAASDPSGDGLWFGFFQGGVAYFAAGRVGASYDESDGLAPGHVTSLYVDSAGALWVATEGGLSRMMGGQVATLTSRNGLPCDSVRWVIEDKTGSLWLGMGCGLVRVARDAINAWAAAADNGEKGDDLAQGEATLFDWADGVSPLVYLSHGNAHVTRTADGKLWFVSLGGLSVVDPAHLPFNKVSPAVHIGRIVANRISYDATSSAFSALHLPPLIRDLEIDYTALSLVVPEKNRFRVMLEGRNREWQDIGNRRQVFYTDLAPGTYRFRVIASNNSGVWNETGASLNFAIAPAYYQTTWFRALVLGMVVALVGAAHRIRLRISEGHDREISALNERLMKAQEQERMRIAGELHDGVMQQMMSVTLMLGTAKRRVTSNPSEATAAIEKVQEKLIQAGSDIRQLSHGLHPPILQEAGLAEAARSYCEEFSAARGIPVRCDADEVVRDLSRGAALALFRVLQEALGNAAKYAQATQITVRLTRTNGDVSLTVSDDGVGSDPTARASGGRLGLVMMRERATQLNGTFYFASTPGRGTTISMVIPFR